MMSLLSFELMVWHGINAFGKEKSKAYSSSSKSSIHKNYNILKGAT